MFASILMRDCRIFHLPDVTGHAAAFPAMIVPPRVRFPACAAEGREGCPNRPTASCPRFRDRMTGAPCFARYRAERCAGAGFCGAPATRIFEADHVSLV